MMLSYLHAALSGTAVPLYVLATIATLRTIDFLPDEAFKLRFSIGPVWGFLLFCFGRRPFEREKDGRGWGVVYTAMYLLMLTAAGFAIMNAWHTYSFWAEGAWIWKNLSWRIFHITAPFGIILISAGVCFATANNPQLIDKQND